MACAGKISSSILNLLRDGVINNGTALIFAGSFFCCCARAHCTHAWHGVGGVALASRGGAQRRSRSGAAARNV